MTSTITPNTDQKPHRKLMAFKKFVASKGGKQRPVKAANWTKTAQSKINEQTVDLIDSDVRDSIFALIPTRSYNRDITIELVAEKLREISKTMDIAVTCVGFNSAQSN